MPPGYYDSNTIDLRNFRSGLLCGACELRRQHTIWLSGRRKQWEFLCRFGYDRHSSLKCEHTLRRGNAYRGVAISWKCFLVFRINDRGVDSTSN